jgi:hypothetical protein
MMKMIQKRRIIIISNNQRHKEMRISKFIEYLSLIKYLVKEYQLEQYFL